MSNPYIIVPIVAWVVGQVAKFTYNAIRGDFDKKYKSVKHFASLYMVKESQRKRFVDAKVSYTHYDWNLNDI